MNSNNAARPQRRRGSRLSAFAVGLLAGLSSLSAMSDVAIDNKPLSVVNNVPGNLGIVLSAEAPTLVSVANLGDYSQAKEYAGYFDPAKCYKYVYSATETERHFYPVSVTANRACPNTDTNADGRLWSGNFMNWAVTQAIDPFRKEMTGGYRVKDTETSTWLEKAIADRNHPDSNAPRTTPASGNDTTLVGAATPAAWPTFRTRVYNLGNKLWFTVHGQASALTGGYVTNDVPMPNGASSPVAGAGNSPNVVSYNPAYHRLPNTATNTATNGTACASGEAGCTTATTVTTNACTDPSYRNFRISDGRCHSANTDASTSVANNCPTGSNLPTSNGQNQVCSTPQYTHTNYGNDRVYEVSVRVAVCVPGLLEPNCRAYGGNYKPEGLIQEYSKKLTYSLFSYGNNGRGGVGSGNPPDGGVMRSAQKFVGPKTKYPDDVGADANGEKDNPRTEWNPATGQFYANPDSSYLATANTAYYDGTNSGLINYINKFGQMNTGRLSKYYDNVSELYYAAFRYFRNLENVASYSSPFTSAQTADAFPVIRWAPGTGTVKNDDPYRYKCQVSAILGIGDTNTATDKALPGSTATGSGEGAIPVDPGVDVVTDLKRILKIEGLSDWNSYATASNFGSGGTAKSGFIASLAYHANLRDLRSDLDGDQNISTFWVDIVEFFNYKNRSGMTTTAPDNQYWLAAKYGDPGLRGVVNPDYAVAGAAPTPALGSWSATGQYVVNANTGANVYQRPNNFYTAADAREMGNGLRAAFARIVDDISGSGGSFASNTTKLEVGSRTYQAKYISNGWGGRLAASDVDVTTGTLTDRWDASDWLGQAAGDAKINTSATTLDYTEREVLYNNGGTLAPFISTAGVLTKPTGLSALTPDQLKYVLGERIHERQSTATGSQHIFRNRRGMLGDIINSTPVYVGKPNANLYSTDATYAAFATAQASRTPVVFVGANDGMLHAFKAPDASVACTATGAECGKELFAFMPTEAMAVLQQNDPSSNKYPYWDPEYDHAYSVDGELTVADVKIDDTTWKTVLVGTMGRGGKTVFALDVTDPASPTLLWEKTSADAAIGTLLGNSLGRPIIAKVADGDWRVFLGNGPNSTAGTSALIALDVMTGSNDGSVNTGVGSPNNGLSPVNVWDAYGSTIPSTPDGNFDTVYAGDMSGALWKFNLTTSTATKLYQTRTGQPITAAPLAARNPYSPPDTWLFFGTGRYLSMADVSTSANAVVQSWYGLIDRNALVVQANLKKSSIEYQDAVGRVIEKVAAPGTDGWYIDLQSPAEAGGTAGAKGERMVVPNFFQGMTLIGTTRFPDSNDPCSPSGKGYTMAIDPFTGGRLSNAFFDINNSGTVGDTGDYYGGSTSTPYSGVGYDSGPNNPIFLGSYMYTSLDNGSYAKLKTSAGAANVKRVSWRELLNAN